MGQKLGVSSNGSYPSNEWIINQLLASKKVLCLTNPNWAKMVQRLAPATQQTSLGIVSCISKTPACLVEMNKYSLSLRSELAQCHLCHTLITNLTNPKWEKKFKS